MEKNVTKYEHTQIGYLIIVVLFAVVLIFASILTQAENEPVLFVAYAIILGIIASFASLKVTIDGAYLRLKFGYGLFRKKFLLADIVSARSVKNHWYYGWGIRYWRWPKMWIFNVSGFGAVEITMKDGKVFRIGTDESKKLEFAINNEIELLQK